MLKFFAEKKVSSFCSAKATHIFSAKNIRILYIESAETVNEMFLNELVKLTMLSCFITFTVVFFKSFRKQRGGETERSREGAKLTKFARDF